MCPGTIENEQTVETRDATSDEILALKKELAEEFVKKNFGSKSFIKRWAIRKYLVDNDTKIDSFIDNYIIWVLWKVFRLLPPDIEEYREMFTKADTKRKLEELTKTISSGIWWAEQASPAINNPDTPTEISDAIDTDWIVKKACQTAIDIANDNSYWYVRWWTGNTNSWKWFDCQSFVRHCYIKAWINVPPSWSCDRMKPDFEKVWFECITFNKNDKLKPWDILVNAIPTRKRTGHTEMYIWENQIAWAHWNKDGRAWDSGWEEISIRNIETSLKFWNPQFILRYKWNSAS